jgi:ribosome-associated translation inhibitor RaiA
MESKIKFMGDFSRVNEEERNFINKRIEKFEQKYQPLFSEMLIKMDCHLHKETSRGRFAHYCRITVATDQGKFTANDQEFSAEQTISRCLDKIEKQITRSFESKKPKFITK